MYSESIHSIKYQSSNLTFFHSVQPATEVQKWRCLVQNFGAKTCIPRFSTTFSLGASQALRSENLGVQSKISVPRAPIVSDPEIWQSQLKKYYLNIAAAFWGIEGFFRGLGGFERMVSYLFRNSSIILIIKHTQKSQSLFRHEYPDIWNRFYFISKANKTRLISLTSI